MFVGKRVDGGRKGGIIFKTIAPGWPPKISSPDSPQRYYIWPCIPEATTIETSYSATPDATPHRLPQSPSTKRNDTRASVSLYDFPDAWKVIDNGTSSSSPSSSPPHKGIMALSLVGFHMNISTCEFYVRADFVSCIYGAIFAHMLGGNVFEFSHLPSSFGYINFLRFFSQVVSGALSPKY